MVILHKYQLIFIKTMKTAGTSVEVFLSNFCDDDDVLTPIHPSVEPHFPMNFEGFKNHMAASDLRGKISERIWNSYLKICIERNPWDKTLSHYYMLNYRSGGKLTLDRYFASGIFCQNYPIYTSRKDINKIIVDKVIYYEQLSSRLHSVFKKVGIPFYGSLGVRAKSNYRKDRRHYRDVLSPQQSNIIGRIFSHEIKLHNYRF